MDKKIAIGFLAVTLYAAPLQAEPANPVAPTITKPNNDATLRALYRRPHHIVVSRAKRNNRDAVCFKREGRAPEAAYN
jgi:hypothetical protein